MQIERMWAEQSHFIYKIIRNSNTISFIMIPIKHIKQSKYMSFFSWLATHFMPSPYSLISYDYIDAIRRTIFLSVRKAHPNCLILLLLELKMFVVVAAKAALKLSRFLVSLFPRNEKKGRVQAPLQQKHNVSLHEQHGQQHYQTTHN